MDIGRFVDRRLHPVRLAVALLREEVERSRGDAKISLDRDRARSILETVSLFVEDFELSHRAAREAQGAQRQAPKSRFAEAEGAEGA